MSNWIALTVAWGGAVTMLGINVREWRRQQQRRRRATRRDADMYFVTKALKQDRQKRAS
jgi:hypothetical protein